MERLRAQQQRLAVTQRFAGSRCQAYYLVFPSALGTSMEPTNLIRRFKKLLKIAGLPDIRIHDLRHTSAILLLLRGGQSKRSLRALGARGYFHNLTDIFPRSAIPASECGFTYR
jgi:integrase